MDRQTLRDWVHRYNAEGIAGLADAPRGGRPPVLTSEQMAELRGIVLAGPDPARHGVVRWRCVDLCDQIAERFDVEMHERTVGTSAPGVEPSCVMRLIVARPREHRQYFQSALAC